MSETPSEPAPASAEPTKVELSNIIPFVPTPYVNFDDILLMKIEQDDKIKDVLNKLFDPKSVALLKPFIPDITRELESIKIDFDGILIDGQISTSDMPRFLSIFRDMYTIVHKSRKIKLSKNKKFEFVVSLLKLIIVVYLEIAHSGGDDKTKTLERFYKLVDTSNELLTLTRDLKSSCCGCF